MIHASLFSGIGGFDLAAEWAGWTNAFNCEIDPFCRTILKYHFPNAKQYEDIRTADFTIWKDRIDVLTGGFPCQPFSLAGKWRGTEDDRYLWPAMLALFGLFDPAGSWARTFTESLIGRKGWSSNRCALTWRRQDTRCSRTLFRLAVSALPTVGTDVGLLPTVQTQGLKRCVNGKMVFMPLSLLPTPTAIDAGSGRMNKSLSPNASERPTLAMASKMGLLPTPTANDAKNVTLPASQGIRNGLPKTAMQSDEYRTGTGSRLNPLYVAEMMGFPGNWLVSPFLGGAGKPSKPAETP